jgi:hypothetical protein
VRWEIRESCRYGTKFLRDDCQRNGSGRTDTLLERRERSIKFVVGTSLSFVTPCHYSDSLTTPLLTLSEKHTRLTHAGFWAKSCKGNIDPRTDFEVLSSLCPFITGVRGAPFQKGRHRPDQHALHSKALICNDLKLITSSTHHGCGYIRPDQQRGRQAFYFISSHSSSPH